MVWLKKIQGKLVPCSTPEGALGEENCFRRKDGKMRPWMEIGPLFPLYGGRGSAVLKNLGRTRRRKKSQPDSHGISYCRWSQQSGIRGGRFWFRERLTSGVITMIFSAIEQ